MSLIPITRDELKQLKIQADEEKRRATEEKRKAVIESAIKTVYGIILGMAKEESSTKHLVVVNKHHMCQQYRGEHFGDFFDKSSKYFRSSLSSVNLEDDMIPFVLSGVQELFPDSKVALMACAPDRKMYDVSTLVSPFIQPHMPKAIVVDWS